MPRGLAAKLLTGPVRFGHADTAARGAIIDRQRRLWWFDLAGDSYPRFNQSRYDQLYDERLSDYNASYGLSGNWSERVLTRLAGPESMSGRHRLREALERLGLPSR